MSNKSVFIVTGAAGFIGSCIVSSLNQDGYNAVIAVDHIAKDDPRQNNLAGKKILDYFDKYEFLDFLPKLTQGYKIGCIIHMGACSSTTLQDADYFEENNYEYSRRLAEWALENNIHFIYASSAATYGDGSLGYKDDIETVRHCQPLNLYGESKQKFDLWILNNNLINKVTGLKFFNVFGPNEYHKKDMRSVVAKAYQRVMNEGKISLFKSYKEEYADGEQKRDFIYVKDAVDIVRYFWQHPDVHGIYNAGTGRARTWNALAASLFEAVGKPLQIEYIDMPEDLRARYQYFTQADVTKLRQTGYVKEFTSLEDAVVDYVGYLQNHLYI